MKKLILLVFVLFSHNSFAQSDIYLELGKKIYQSLDGEFKTNFKVLQTKKEKILVKTNLDSLGELSGHIHDKFNQCGGYLTYFDLQEAKKEFNKTVRKSSFVNPLLYKLNQAKQVKSLINLVQENNIRTVIQKLSAFHNRYYAAQTGVDAMQYIKNTWQDLVRTRSDAKVEFFQHSRWVQPSVILTIEGSGHPNDIIVVGGHGDSIAGWFGRSSARAPGADDNASGIATITEIVRALVESNYKPSRTLQFMAYAAEEVGLLGSKEIASTYRKQGKNVIGVVQLDMTNFNGSANDITLIKDHTDSAQNDFLAQLMDSYLPHLKWGWDSCGYACSDHASWTGQGFPASMPFEASKGKMNRHIHTSRDTIQQSGGNANHAVKFAKLGLAFVAELDR